MPKKSTRHVRDSGTTKRPPAGPGNKAKRHPRCVEIGVDNGRRWARLKKKLGLITDELLAAHLLDLADAALRQEDGCTEREEWKPDRGDDGTEQEAPKLRVANVEAEEPLRRSPRKQCLLPTPEPQAQPENAVQPDPATSHDENLDHVRRSCRNKHHKSKTKHHKDKRKKKKHCRNLEEEAQAEPNQEDMPSVVLEEEKVNDSVVEKVVDRKVESRVEVVVERLRGPTIEEPSIKPETEGVARVVFVEDVNRDRETEKFREESCEQVTTHETEENRKLKSDSSECSPVLGDRKGVVAVRDEVISDICENVQIPEVQNTRHENDEQSVQSFRDNCQELANPEDKGLDPANNNQDPSEAHQEDKNDKDQDERKLKKKRKRHQLDDEPDSKDCHPEESAHKHRKKKHKHAGEHKNKKHHDVRKAPQDGIVVIAEDPPDPRPPEAEQPPVIPSETFSAELNPEAPQTEPQRFAIKIKLCQDCNSRHLQDACPLAEPDYSIPDAISHEDWLRRHSGNQEVQKAVRSADPMSEGYGRPQEDGFESDEEQLGIEQQKTRVKIESEEKQLVVDGDRPIFARESLPECFELKVANAEHGLGIFAKGPVPMYARLGPLIGKPVREMDIPDDFSMRHIWEIENLGKTSYISTTDPLRSNWIRYMRPAETKEERSVAVVTRRGELHLVTTQNILPGSELTYWADSQSSAWTRKNKMDKTNCGGCNLNFAHPIYYRLHCCIFHDTNYSLTIRKYHCKVCGAAVLGKDNIMKHAAELHAGRGAYQCQYCKKFFLRLNYLEMHRTYGCAQNPQRSRPLCDFCGRKFCQPQKLKVHIKRMHSDMSEVLREFQCKLCLKLLGSRAALQRHMKEVHHKDVVGAATCDRCGKMFQNKSNLKIHMLTHSGVKPFKCKENGCKAAFTTKQCLQFHYKKVHGLSEEMMPKIERSVAYTFDAYSGGLIEDSGRGKSLRLNMRDSQDNSNSIPSLDDCSSENSLKAETPTNPTQSHVIEFRTDTNTPSKCKLDQETHSPPTPPPPTLPMPTPIDNGPENVRAEVVVDLYASSRLQSKGSKKWMGEFNPPTVTSEAPPHPPPAAPPDVYEFEDRKEEEKMSRVLMDDSKLGLSVYRRTESSNASLLVEAALDAAERDIGAVSSPILEDNDRDTNLYSISTHLQSPMPQRSPESHLDSYIQQQEDLMSPAPTPDNRHTPPNHIHMDYHIHRPLDYMNPRTHSMEQYLHHEDLPRVSSPNNYIHVHTEDLVSPAATPNPRYQDVHHHHQVPTDNLSSDEGDSVAQNLSLSVKEKALQLDLSTSYKYDPLESDFGRERSNFEPLLLNSGELQGLDMSARGFHHSFGAQVQNTRYHHHHLYEITERQSVDLSRTGGYSMSPPPPPPPPYPHSDVLRVVSLDLTPGGRHSVDLSLSRSHHLHGTGARMIASPQPPGSSTPHVVPDAIEGRILSSPPPGYNPTYPVSPAPYHPPRPGYHHYTGYY